MRFLKNVRIEGYVNKWYGNLDNKLWTRHCLGFIVEIVKAIVKKKRTLAFYTLHTIMYDKKDPFIGGWVHPRTEDRGSGWLNQKYRQGQDLRI
jgi:hypothetical protein